MRFDIEYTDTFGGEANYCWVKRASIEAADNISGRALMRRAKAAMGLSNVRGRKDDTGETIAFRPYGSCTVMFINPNY